MIGHRISPLMILCTYRSPTKPHKQLHAQLPLSHRSCRHTRTSSTSESSKTSPTRNSGCFNVSTALFLENSMGSKGSGNMRKRKCSRWVPRMRQQRGCATRSRRNHRTPENRHGPHPNPIASTWLRLSAQRRPRNCTMYNCVSKSQGRPSKMVSDHTLCRRWSTTWPPPPWGSNADSRCRQRESRCSGNGARAAKLAHRGDVVWLCRQVAAASKA